jgi:hypothetical protein
MDLTPWAGIIGAVVGAAIGFLAQRMNIAEQRRKDRLERIASLLQAADRVVEIGERLVESRVKTKTVSIGGFSGSTEDAIFREALRDARHHYEYLILSSAGKLTRSMTPLLKVVYDLESAVEEREPTQALMISVKAVDEDYQPAREILMRVANHRLPRRTARG